MKIDRAPGIHIHRQFLESILVDIYEDYEDNIEALTPKKLAALIFDRSKGHSLNHRSVTITNDKLKRDTTKITAAGRSNTSLFCQIMKLVRTQMKHRGITIPKAGSEEFKNYKEATKLATEFCNEEGLTLKEGYQQYIKIGMGMMKTFSIYKFKNLHAGILQKFEALSECKLDKYPNETKRAHSVYLSLISDKIGFTQGFEDNPEKYRFFVQSAGEARRIKIDVATYIQAQFHGFDWRSAIPDPAQLVGYKAIDRLQRYCYEEGIKVNSEEHSPKPVDWSKIKGKGL